MSQPRSLAIPPSTNFAAFHPFIGLLMRLPWNILNFSKYQTWNFLLDLVTKSTHLLELAHVVSVTHRNDFVDKWDFC